MNSDATSSSSESEAESTPEPVAPPEPKRTSTSNKSAAAIRQTTNIKARKQNKVNSAQMTVLVATAWLTLLACCLLQRPATNDAPAPQPSPRKKKLLEDKLKNIRAEGAVIDELLQHPDSD